MNQPLRTSSSGHRVIGVIRSFETVSQPFFRPFGACVYSTFNPRLAPWAVLHPSEPKPGSLGTPLLRRFAAQNNDRVPLFSRRPGCDAGSFDPHQGDRVFYHPIARCEIQMLGILCQHIRLEVKETHLGGAYSTTTLPVILG